MDKNSKSTPKFDDVPKVDLNQLVDDILNVDWTTLVDMVYVDEHNLPLKDNCRSDSSKFQQSDQSLPMPPLDKGSLYFIAI